MRTRERQKRKIKLFIVFGQLFAAQNGQPENDLRAHVLAKRERKGEIETQKELMTAQKGAQIMG